jgi:hypothetical protein
MIEIIPFQPEHAYEILGKRDPLTIKFAEAFKQGFAYTALLDNRLFACGGVMTHWAGCGEAWFASFAF